MPRPRARDLSLYKLHTSNAGFVITKFDRIGFEVLSQYELIRIDGLDDYSCPCPQGLKPSCRHRKMLPFMIPKADSEEFFCYDTQEWKRLDGLAATAVLNIDPAYEEPLSAQREAPIQEVQVRPIDSSMLVGGGPITNSDLKPFRRRV